MIQKPDILWRKSAVLAACQRHHSQRATATEQRNQALCLEPFSVDDSIDIRMIVHRIDRVVHLGGCRSKRLSTARTEHRHRKIVLEETAPVREINRPQA